MIRLARPTRLFASLCLLFAMAATGAAAATPSEAGAKEDRAEPFALHVQGPPRSARYIVQLSEPPLATYRGGQSGLEATAILPAHTAGGQGHVAPVGPGADGRARLDTESPAARAYRSHLLDRQAELEGRIAGLAPEARAQYHYTTLLNGIVLRLTEAQAEAVAGLPGVLAVHEAERIELRMDAANPLVGAPAAWEDPRIGGQADAGRGVRIAIIDSGIAADHPLFDDAGFEAPEGYPQASVTVGDERRELNGQELERSTSAKVIAARYYVNPEAFEADPDTPRDPRPIFSGHGSHVAGIAAGRAVTGAPNSHGRGDIEFSGLAPGAWLMAYRFDEAYTPEIVRAIEDAVADGADVINNSWGTALMNVVSPETHPIAQAFKSAAAANVVVVAAAGNSGGMGPASLGGPHQMIDEVITVGNSQTGRTLHYMVRAEDEGLPEALRVQEGLYIDNGPHGPDWDRLRAPALLANACSDDPAALADRVLLVDFEAPCPDLPVDLPPDFDPELLEAMPDFFKQTAAAHAAGADAVVFYLSGDNPFILLLFVLWELIKGLLPGLDQIQAAPAFLILGEEAGQLVEWSATHPTLEILLDITPEAQVDPAAIDMAAPSTSQGPNPADTRLPVKPDLSAPGTDILSANAVDGEAAGYMLATGTSMSSPAVAGAAVLLRQAHPHWTPAQVKAALMNTSEPVVKLENSQALAPVTTQGAGRLRVDRALDPGLLLDPPSLNLGLRRDGEMAFEVTALDARAQADGPVDYRLRHEPGQTEAGLRLELPETRSVPAGGTVRFDARFALSGLPAGSYDGRIVLESDQHLLRIPYALQVPGEAKDVLLINVVASYESPAEGEPSELLDRTDNADFWTEALDKAELSHEVWTVAVDAEDERVDERDGMPPLSELQRFSLVIVAGGEGNVPLEGMTRGMTPLQMYLLGGGAMLASGHRWPHGLRSVGGSGSQSAGAMFLLHRYFAGFEMLQDDVEHDGPFLPRRLFDKPLRFESGWDPVAESPGLVDLGRPLEQLITSAPPGMPAPDNPWSTPAERIMPYALSFLETEAGQSVMTGVTPDARLEHPQVSPDITWRAMMAAFPVESVGGDPRESLTRAELLEQVFAWATEPEDLELRISGPDAVATGRPMRFVVESELPEGFSGIAGYRWDPGDGSPIEETEMPVLEHRFDAPGETILRVELQSLAGRSFVAEYRLNIEPGEPPSWSLHLPLLLRSAELER